MKRAERYSGRKGPLDSLCSPIYIYFVFDPVFCLFPQLRSLVPGYMVTIDFKVAEIKKLESSEAYLLNLGKNLSWAFEVIYIFCKNAV